MNAFVKKEIRLLLPSWIAVMSLAALLPWLSWKDPDNSFAWMPVFVFFGVILLAVDSFGREFTQGTFSPLMSQPIERRQIWRTKITILFSAAALIFTVFFISSEFLFHHALNISIWNANPKIISTDFRNGMFGCIVAIFIALTGGLWTTLLIRQAAAAFWISFLTPLGILMAIIFFLPAKFPDQLAFPLFAILTVIYIVAGFWFAHRLFYRSQDAAWTGGVISFSTWRYFEIRSKNGVSVRRQKPLTTLFKKEFQLHSISLFCAGALLVLHVGIFILRANITHIRSNSTELMAIASEFFWTLWLVMPLVIGCMAVAEERKLGVMDGQFCLAVSRRWQFVIKFFPAMIFGVLLGGIMPVFLETIAAWLGNPTDLFKAVASGNISYFLFFSDHSIFCFTIIAIAAGLTLIGFFASTLARNFMQALSIAIVAIVACFFSYTFFAGGLFALNGAAGFFGMKLWGGLPILIGLLTIIIFVPWLAWRNFNHFTESKRLWRRNVFGIAGALLFVFASSALIYNRVWELIETAEPAHGTARISLSNPPKLQSNFSGNLQVQFSDGRIWFDNLGLSGYWQDNFNSWKIFWQAMAGRLPRNIGPEQFITRNQWASTASLGWIDWWNGSGSISGYRDTAGIQADGSLWLSSATKPAIWGGTNMLRFGTENNWRQIVGIYGRYFLLLKNDGTLWGWGGKNSVSVSQSKNWPGVRQYQPQQLGTNTDWQEFFPTWSSLVKRTDGQVWQIGFEGKTNEVRFDQVMNYDQVVPQTFTINNSESGYAGMAYIGTNGTLWTRNIRWDEDKQQSRGDGFLQIGTETNWLAVAMSDQRLVALKQDGSLWQWKIDFKSTADFIKNPPTRFGIHNDWVGLTSAWGGMISLAADGSLWFWPGPDCNGLLLKATRKPQFLANVFSKGE